MELAQSADHEAQEFSFFLPVRLNGLVMLFNSLVSQEIRNQENYESFEKLLDDSEFELFSTSRNVIRPPGRFTLVSQEEHR